MNKFNILAGVVGIIATFTGYLFFSNQSSQVISVGTELPQAVALFETSLAAPITSTADTMTLTSNSVRGGGSLSGYNCFTIDEGSAQAEFVCGTVATTTVTGLTRGISPLDGTTEDADLKFPHRRGASVKITDFPIIQLLRSQNNGDGTFENVLRYAGSVVPTGASDLADVGYVLSVVNGGAVSFDALVVAGRAGETVATGTLVYFNSTDQEWYKVNANSTSTFQDTAIGLTQGNGVNAGSISGGILLKGRDDTQTGLIAGATYYASTTAGLLGRATTSQPIGKADSATVLYFDPVMIGTPKLGFNNAFTGVNTFSGTTTLATTTISNLTVTGGIDGATSKLIASSSQQTLSTTTAELTIFSVQVPANYLSTDNAIRFKVYIAGMAWTAGSQLATFRFKYGSTTIATTSAFSGPTDNQNGIIEGQLWANNSTQSQFGVVTLDLMENQTTTSVIGSDAVTTFSHDFDSGTATENSATEKTLSLTFQQTAGTAGLTVTLAGYTVEIIQ